VARIGERDVIAVDPHVDRQQLAVVPVLVGHYGSSRRSAR
jgi:hypothetical protein